MPKTPLFIERDAEGYPVRVNLHPGQAEAYEATERFVAMLAGPQSGKTEFGPYWLDKQIKLHGQGDYLASSANYPLMEKKMGPSLRGWFCKGTPGHYGTNQGRYWAGLKLIELRDPKTGKFWAKKPTDPMWARIYFESAQTPIESLTAMAAWLDEPGLPEFTKKAWDGVERRLLIHQGPCLFTTTLYCWHWLKTDIYDPWAKGDKDYRVIQFDSRLNPVFPEEEYLRVQKLKTKSYFDMMYRGIYEKPSGLIYDAFDGDNCIKSRESVGIKPNWPRYFGVDFGPSNTAAVWFAMNPGNGDLILDHTHKPDGGGIVEHVADWVEISEGENIYRKAGGSHGEQEIRDGYALAKWSLQEPALRTVDAQIIRVNELFAENRIIILDEHIDFLRELQSYVYELDDEKIPTNVIADKAKAHWMDALRYALSGIRMDTGVQQKQVPRVYRHTVVERPNILGRSPGRVVGIA